MRDVAFAGNAPSASATNAMADQISVAFRMPGIQPLPLNFRGPRDTPMTRRPRLSMRPPCHARWRNQSIDFVRNFASHPQLRVHADASETAVCGRNFRAVYASLTILKRWFSPKLSRRDLDRHAHLRTERHDAGHARGQ